ncbi:hypothetical protein AX16_003683 [Volvariella volvacea WC 439]|nr:hypothetical protein AX16_003683 [Volvariella volvacea WC 439]
MEPIIDHPPAPSSPPPSPSVIQTNTDIPSILDEPSHAMQHLTLDQPDSAGSEGDPFPPSASRTGSPTHAAGELPLPIASKLEGGIEYLSRIGTPENDDLLQDEPSSVLASKIIRAHDNPSPPPISPIRSISFSKPLIDFSASPIKPSAVVDEPRLPIGQLPTHTYPSVPDFLSTDDVSPLVQHIGNPNSAEGGMITSPVLLPPSSLDPSHSPPRPSSSQNLVNDHLLVDLRSPSPAVVHEVPSAQRLVESRVGHGEAAQDETPNVDMSPKQSKSIGVSVSLQQEGDTFHGQSITRAPSLESPPPQTPLRRSARTRRSSTRLAGYADFANLPPITPLSIQRKKGKQKAGDTGDILGSPTRVATTPREGKEQESKESKRELDSLSPTSDHLLSSLIPSLERYPRDPRTPSNDFMIPTSSTGFSQVNLPLPTTPLRTAPPLRVLNPLWGGASPSKSVTDDPTRTPARRIPVEQAAAQAQTALREANVFFNNNTPPNARNVFSSPSKRLVSSSKQAQGQPQSSTARPIPERSKSVEPKPLIPLIPPKTRSSSLEPSLPTSRLPVGSTRTAQSSKLPFPLIARMDVPTIPEEGVVESTASGADSTPDATQKAPVPPKSSLRQPTTKIPRVTNKPYARPNTAAPSKLPVKGAKSAVASVSNVEKPKAKPPTPKSQTRTLGQPKLVARSAFSSKPGEGSTSHTTTITSSLKRKRDVPTESVTAAPTKLKPVVVVRQVPSVAAKSRPSPTGDMPKATANGRTNTTGASGPTLRVRRVVDKKPPPPAQPPMSLQPTPILPTPPASSLPSIHPQPLQTIEQEESTVSLHPVPDALAVPSPQVIPPSSEPSRENAQASETLQPKPGHDAPKPVHNDPQTSSPLNQSTTNIPSQDTQPSQESTSRRTTRSRGAVPTAPRDDIDDVFRDKPGMTPQTRRARGTPRASLRSDLSGFAGMSALSLKSLTTTNTTKNQHYTSVTLATEVVRREGARPSSPGMKVKTVSQRQEDEKERQRQERAERRARRSDGGDDIDGPATPDGSDETDDEQLPEFFIDETQLQLPPGKYRRGAGEDEDYETPDRSEAKRRRIEDEGGGSVYVEKRRVKWDKGLFTTIYLDEIKPRSRRLPKEFTIPKGCLAPTSKSIQLDLMGNPPNAEQPLTDLALENVIIKRFVYDDESDPAEPPPAPPPKNTRSKGKKTRST